MKTTKFKIGDYMLFDGMLCKIHSIDQSSIYVDVNNEIYGVLENDDELVPIPLTAEILTKNVWKQDKDGSQCYYMGGMFVRKDLDKWVFGEDDTWITRVPYVHNLQHILWAMDIDDALKL